MEIKLNDLAGWINGRRVTRREAVEQLENAIRNGQDIQNIIVAPGETLYYLEYPTNQIDSLSDRTKDLTYIIFRAHPRTRNGKGKIDAIKSVRARTGMGLKETKKLVEDCWGLVDDLFPE